MAQQGKNDIVGCSFSKLIVKSFHSKDKWGKSTFLCDCECGNKTIVNRSDLILHKTQSCGECSLNKFEFYENHVKCFTRKNQLFLIDLEDFNKIKFYTWSMDNLSSSDWID